MYIYFSAYRLFMVNIAYDTFFKAFTKQLFAFLIVLVLLIHPASALTTTATVTIEDPNSAVIVNNAPMTCGAVVCVGNFGEADCIYAYDFSTCAVWGDYNVTITYTHSGTNCDATALDPVTIVETYEYFIYNCPDTQAPTTSDNYSAEDGVWQDSDQTIMLTESDPVPSSGISSTQYCIDTTDTCIPSINYVNPVTISTEGTSYFRYRSTDNVGNVQTIVSRTVMIDKTGFSVDAGTDKTTNSIFTQDATVTASLSGISSYSWTKISGPGNIIFGSSAAEDTTIWADTDGTYVIRLTVTDNTGNSVSDEMTLVWDIADPTTSDNYASDNIWVTADQAITLTPTDPAPSSGISSTKYCIDTTNTCIPSTDYTVIVPISSEGISYFRYRSVDNAGNVQSIVSRTVKIDKSPPSILIESPLGMTYGTQWIWFNITATDTYNSVDWCGFSLNGSENVTLSEDMPTHFFYFNDTVYLGNYNVVFYCNDSNGLMNSAEVDFDIQYGCTDGVPDYDTKCSVVCGADAECDEDIHGEYKDYCHISGFTYFIDMCSDACLLIDDTQQVCNNTGTNCGGADVECDGYTTGECFPDGLHFCNSVCQNETASGNCIPTPVMRKALVHYTTDPYNRKLEINAIKCLIRIYLGAVCSDPRRQEYIEIAKTFPDSILPN